MTSKRRWPPKFVALLWLMAACRVSAHGADRKADYLLDVRPILADNCFRCHGMDEQSREAGLRLDHRDAALHGGESGEPAIVPGKPNLGELLKRVASSDDSERMPPPDAKAPLTAAQIETLRDWIADGAPYQTHWALVAPHKPPATAVSSDHWGATEIDSFVLSRLKREKLTPSPEAKRA